MNSSKDAARQRRGAAADRELRVFTFAESLGGVESLIAHPETMTHADMGDATRQLAGIGSGLLRLSVGLEAEHDLVVDLKLALTAC